MKRLQKYEAGIDCYTPFSDGKYEVVWNENDFKLKYDYDGQGNNYKVIVVKYAE